MSQLRHVVRRIKKTPAFLVTVLATLGLGIGATIAVFSVISGVLLEPLPYDEPGELVSIWHSAPGLGFERINQCAAFDLTYGEQTDIFQSTGMWRPSVAALTGQDEPEEVVTLGVTKNVLEILGQEAERGRRFEAEDDQPGAPLTAMISHDFWHQRFGGRDDVVGSTLRLNGREREVIGVLSRSFEFLEVDPQVVLPLQVDTSQVIVGQFNFQGIARLQPGVSLAEANAAVDRLIPLAVEEYPGGLSLEMLQDAQFAAALRPLEQDVVGDISQVLWVLLAAVGLVLLIACANVANLYLVRAESRQRELALRTALGAGRGRLMRDLLSESLVLGLLGGVIGVLIAWGLVRLLVAIGPESVPRLDQIGVDGRLVLFSLAVSLAAGALFGTLPAIRQALGFGGGELATSLKEGGRTGTAGLERHRLRSALVVAQVALGLVLLVGSGLMLRSFWALQKVDAGFTDPESVFSFRVSIPSAEVEDGDDVVLLQQRIQARLAAIPGVEHASATSSLPFNPSSSDALLVEEFPAPADKLPPIRRFKFVTPGYFETMGNPLISGRSLEWRDALERRPVAVITENLAREYWGDPVAALGKRISDGVLGDMQPSWKEVVGVVGNVHDDGLHEDAPAIVFWPTALENFWGGRFEQRSMVFTLRTERSREEGLLREAQAAVWAENRNLPLANPTTLGVIYERALARSSFSMLMLGLAAGMALTIGAVGIYGVISYIVSQRTQEIGVRIAVGARGRDVNGMMVRYGMVLAGAGVFVGLVAAGLLAGALSRLLYGVEPRDPLTFGAVAIVLALIALGSSSLAGLRASRVDPIEALRGE